MEFTREIGAIKIEIRTHADFIRSSAYQFGYVQESNR